MTMFLLFFRVCLVEKGHECAIIDDVSPFTAEGSVVSNHPSGYAHVLLSPCLRVVP